MTTTLKGMAAQAVGQPTHTQPSAAPLPGGDDDFGEAPANVDPRAVYNENRKLQRLLQKQMRETQSLRDQFAPMQQSFGKMQELQKIFGRGVQQEEEGEATVSAYEKAMRAHQRALELDPDSGGLPLTVDTAREASEAMKLVRQQAALIEQMTKKLEVFEKPQFAAEQNLFVALDDMLRDEVASIYGDDAVEENYPDFERLAIERLKKMRADPKQWRKLLADSQARRSFVSGISSAKIPRGYAKRGAQEIEQYTMQDAMRDIQKADAMGNDPKTRSLREQLRKKARMAILEPKNFLDGM